MSVMRGPCAGYASLLALLVGCAPKPQPAADANSDAGEALHQLFADEWSTRLRDDPLFATASDVHDYDDRLPAVTPADFARRLEQDRGYQQRLAAIPRTALSHEDQVSYDIFDFVLKHRIALAPFKPWRIPLTSDEGFHIDVMRMARASHEQLRDYENYIARLRAVPPYFEQQTGNLRQGMADGFTLPAVILPGIIKVLEGQQYASAEKSAFWEPFTRFPDTISAADQERLKTAGARRHRERRDSRLSTSARVLQQGVPASGAPDHRCQ